MTNTNLIRKIDTSESVQPDIQEQSENTYTNNEHLYTNMKSYLHDKLQRENRSYVSVTDLFMTIVNYCDIRVGHNNTYLMYDYDHKQMITFRSDDVLAIAFELMNGNNAILIDEPLLKFTNETYQLIRLLPRRYFKSYN